jgi:AraC family transcriptional regulator of adaptative response/methylated-DNA-[protein]-cysteine methyltransferase
LDEPVTLRELGRALGMSAFHLQRAFKKLAGVSPKAYVDGRRAERFKELLKARGRVTEAVYDAGFGAPSRAYETSRSRLGMTPFTYARGGRGMNIRYIITKTPFGLILVATTERGICRVATAGTREALRKELAKEFPKATLEPADAELKPWVSRILDHIEGVNGELSLPLDVRATAFQRRVWEALRKIPYGETRSYSEIARSIGAPKAVRAVGGACGQNPVALVIPCHRVIREDGSLGGFGWGLDVKRRLLESERAGAIARSRRPRQKNQVQGSPKELR